MEKKWIIIITSGTLIMGTLIVALLIHASFHRDICIEDVCRTPECVQIAARILNYIDRKTNPCENFYQFVCGNFLRTSEIPDDAGEISSTSLLNDEIQKQLKAVLEEEIEMNETKTLKEVKAFYRACSNTEAIERRGLKIIRELLKEVGGWPVLEDYNWENNQLDWYYYVYKFRQLGLTTNQLLNIGVQYDFKNSTFHIIQIDQPEFDLPRQFLIDEKENNYVEQYRRYMVNIAVYLGAQVFRAAVELRDALKFEMKLANFQITLSKEDRTNFTSSYNIMTIWQLQQDYPSFHWLEYINNLIAPHYQVTTNERILVLVPDYIKRLEDLLHRTSKRDQINYLVWKAISHIVPYVNEDLREIKFKFQRVKLGSSQRLPRWKECVQETYKSFPIAISELYVDRYYNDNITRLIREITRNIKEEYAYTVNKLNWMTSKTKTEVLTKTESIMEVIGYPREFNDAYNLQEIYGKAEVNVKEYLRSFLNLTKLGEDFKFKRLRMLKMKTVWMEHSKVSEAYSMYTPISNTITLGAGLLQGLYFYSKHPNYLNYGAIGFLIGNEITHAFDGTGRLFDRYGNMVNPWDEKSEEAYLEKAECLVDQYDDYNVTEINQTISGLLTLDDNIADNVGIKHAYSAYVNWTKKNGEEKKLPGLDYIPNQLFWISFALSRCSKQRPEHLEVSMASDPHSPSEFRVIGSVSNLREFASDFDCPDDSPMYEEDNCVVW